MSEVVPESAYEREQRLYDEALEIPAGPERDAYLAKVCGNDATLRASLDDLLACDEQADEFFASNSNTLVQLVDSVPIVYPASGANPAIGTNIGPYRIVELIGEGGCGSVFVAEQTHPFRRKVALKIIRIGMDTKTVISRFEAERQALALMDHPNIAHVLDAGTTRNGLPYFVMELVQGASITRYCDENRLTIPERLRLFAMVCNAIQHAHQKGIIHRDIKPSNILITVHDRQPVPKVIDFGIAKTTDIPLTENELVTQNIQMLGTPAYMSPEQADRSAQGLDTRSDIYSLGVLLYELLAGRPPFDPEKLSSCGMSEMLRILRETEPPLVSSMLEGLASKDLATLARDRGTDAHTLISAVQGDLDWIARKALEKERARRYESAHGFAADIRRHLAHEPVVACPPTRRYVLGKMMRRNRMVFASVAAMAVVLVIATVVSTRLYWGEREARQGLMRAQLLQTQLREEADKRRDQAEELLRLAKAREAVTQAVVLLRDGNFPAADKLVEGAPLIRPTPEGADVFRRLGEWHESQGRWSEAAERFSYLVKVNYLDPSDLPSLDHLRAGTVLVESGDLDAFEKFRRSMIDRYANTTDMRSAERTVKVALLVPAGGDLMRDLDRLIDASVDSLKVYTHERPPEEIEDLDVWRMTSVALGEHRRGRFEQAEYWARRCLEISKNELSREATARVLLALAVFQQGHHIEARSQLELARAMVPKDFARRVEDEDAFNGWWPDWLIARILLREADALVHQIPEASSARAE
ncbi:MAG: serine/threonine protein kinase [Verrucomicrobiae bacterium]|nr:serine/threonine protein kinase [Verrucomicrobiae bacterium]